MTVVDPVRNSVHIINTDNAWTSAIAATTVVSGTDVNSVVSGTEVAAAFSAGC